MDNTTGNSTDIPEKTDMAGTTSSVVLSAGNNAPDFFPRLDSSISQQDILQKDVTQGGKAVDEDLRPDLPSLRTYKQDVTGVMRQEKTSLIKIVLEEQRAKQQAREAVSPRKAKNAMAIGLSVFLLLASGALLYLVFLRDALSPDEKTLQALDVYPIVSVEKNKEIVIDISASDEPARAAVLDRIQNGKLTLDTVEYIFFTEKLNIQTKDGIVEQKNIIGTEKFFAFINLDMPSVLKRALGEEFMFGIHAFNGNEPFFILTTNYYDNAFAGMLEWERRMSETVLPFFGRGEKVRALLGRKFQDRVIKNKDVRVLLDPDNNISLVYFFKDEHTLIITTSEDTLLELSRRLDLSRGKK